MVDCPISVQGGFNQAKLRRNTLPRLNRSRRKSQSEEIFTEREVRIVKRIALQHVAPLRIHVIDFRQKSDLLRRAVVEAATSRLVVNQVRVWRPDNPIAGFAQPQAKIDVVESDCQIFIEPSEL